MHPDNMKLSGTLYINGEEIGTGIPDFECSWDDIHAEFKKDMKISLDPEGSFTATLNTKIDMLWMAKLFGIWQWVYDLCPNRRVIHLAQYGKNKRVKIKNFKRACRITAKAMYLKGE